MTGELGMMGEYNKRYIQANESTEKKDDANESTEILDEDQAISSLSGLDKGPSNSPLLRKCKICRKKFRHNNRLIKHMKKCIVKGLLVENIVIDGFQALTIDNGI